MIDKPNKEVPDAVRATLEKMVHQVMDQCDQLGIAWADYYQAMLQEQKQNPKISVEDLFQRTFRRLERNSN
jgi:hypothetical protein